MAALIAVLLVGVAVTVEFNTFRVLTIAGFGGGLTHVFLNLYFIWTFITRSDQDPHLKSKYS